MMHRFVRQAAVAALLVVSGLVVSDGTTAAPQGDPSTIVFVRPESFGWDASVTVFDVVDEHPVLQGILAAESRLEVQVPSGAHTFMVLCKGNKPAYLSAVLAPGKTYLAYVAMHRSMFTPASCSLDAVRGASTRGAEISKWLADTKRVELDEPARRWEVDNAASITEKFAASYPAWQETNRAQPPMLGEGDSR